MTATGTGPGRPRVEAPLKLTGAARYATAAVLAESGFGANAAAPVVRHVFETVAHQTPQDLAPVDSGKSD